MSYHIDRGDKMNTVREDKPAQAVMTTLNRTFWYVVLQNNGKYVFDLISDEVIDYE